MNLIKERMNKGYCPICNQLLTSEFKIIKNKQYGKVWICKTHKVDIKEENE